jgi:hypothetical protein
MEPRKFAIGNRVRLLLDNYADGSPVEVYEVSRILPAQDNLWQYRVKRVSDGRERAISEPQLAGAEPPEMVARPEIGAQQEQQRIRNARASARSLTVARRDTRNRR